MNRNKYSKEFEEEMIKKAKNKKIVELLEIANKKYNYNITKSQLRQYLSKRNIIYKDYKNNMVRNMCDKVPIGTEYIKSDGMTLIKISKNKWQYKQRYIYEQYYNVKLKSDEYIIFLDQNRNNFDISNLMKISRHESSILSNQKIFSKNPKVTEAGVQVAKLIIKIKNVGKIA